MSKQTSGAIRTAHVVVERVTLLRLVLSLAGKCLLVEFMLAMSELALLAIRTDASLDILSAELSLVLGLISGDLLLGLDGRVEDDGIVVFDRVKGGSQVSGRSGVGAARVFEAGISDAVSGGGSVTGFSRDFSAVFGGVDCIPSGIFVRNELGKGREGFVVVESESG
jgi:hypothetical protein